MKSFQMTVPRLCNLARLAMCSAIEAAELAATAFEVHGEEEANGWIDKATEWSNASNYYARKAAELAESRVDISMANEAKDYADRSLEAIEWAERIVYK